MRTDDFWRVVRTLQQAAGQAVYADSEWETQLRAAQKEAGEGRRQQFAKPREREEGQRFVRPHAPALAVAAEVIQGRTDERTIMNSFVREPSSAAPAYLCWHADAPVGKTALLADYVRRSPRGIDILNFFVSAEHGSDTRAEFEAQVSDQIRELLQTSEPRRPAGSREWHRLFAEATKRNGKLLLVVDGLDDDVAWSAPAARGVRGSIAALLPLAPPPGMRVIVSLRRCVRFPDDLAPTHPLRRPEYQHTLTALTGIPLIRRTPPDTTPLGIKMARILAVSGGGLRTEDLAELADFPTESVDRWAQGPGGRALVFEDPVLGTYTLAQPAHATATRASLAAEGVARCTRQLLAWSSRWRTAGWPDGTPPYPLIHQLRLLTDPDERAEYVLDLPRLRRLVAQVGPDAALAQLDRLEEEIGAPDTAPGSLAILIRLAVTRDVLRGESRAVPSGAPALLVRLGETERARALARSATTAADRAVHLADVAVELAHAERDDAEAVAREAAELYCPVPLDAHADPELPVLLLGAADALASLKSHDAARLLLHAVVGDRTAGTEVLTRAAALLTTVGDPALLTVLRERAEDLSQGGVRARAVAVDLWGALARATPMASVPDGDRIEAICKELEPEDGLGAVDVLAVAVSALSALPHQRRNVPRGLLRDALDRITEALADPDALSPDDQAHLRRELAGTLAHLTRAVGDAAPLRSELDDMRRMLDSLPEQLRIGVLGDVTAERARAVAEVAEARRAEKDAKAVAAAKEAKNAARRAEYPKAKQREKEKQRTLQESRGKRTAAQTPPPVQVRTPGPGTPRPHRPSTGLPPADAIQHPEHLRLLQEADSRLGTGDLLRSRQLLVAALRHSPLSSATPLPALAGWQADLVQALGMAGEFSEAEALAHEMPDRARHFAALSLGCSLGGHTAPGAHYAREAARLATGDADPALANAVAQALAHAGAGSAAQSLVTGRVAEKRQALTAVAAGLVRHDPEEAARIAQPLIEALVLRSDGDTTLRTIPELAALLLAHPDIRHPGRRLREALRLALVPAARAAQSWHAPSMTVLALLARIGCVPGEESDTVAGMVDRWHRSLQHRQQPYAELALLAAVYGDEDALRCHTEAAPTPYGRATALSAVATYLAGTPVALATDSRADDRVLRTCLALARAAGDGRPPDLMAARSLVRGLLETGAWAHSIPLLPVIAPAALRPVGEVARDIRRHAEGPRPEDAGAGPAPVAVQEDGPHDG
ncbi:hypothetical protein ACIPPM_01905 [Streptomyces sp. NPDC090119]|uniref:hypothetical protein n=1 Tax=Streptomyces sp. NPDC090119 TaxID=3365951 RepID=UPI00380FE871